MAHELEINENGEARMFYAGKTPWHGLGTSVETEITAEAAIRLAGLDYTLEKKPLFIQGENTVDNIPVIGSEAEGFYGVVRKEDQKVVGVVKGRYEIIQMKDCFDFMDSVVGEGQAIYHTAGSLFGGSRAFLTIKLPGSIKVGPDQIDRYVMLATSHDGTLPLVALNTGTRVVCNNTMNIALGHATTQRISIRHTKSFASKVEEARKVLGLADMYYEWMEKCFNKLLDEEFNNDQMDNYLNRLFDSESTRSANIRQNIMGKFHNGIGIEAVKNTKWAAFNAVTEWVDHERGNQDKLDSKLNNIMCGTGQAIAQQAYDLLAV